MILSAALPLARLLPAEMAHGLALRALAYGLVPGLAPAAVAAAGVVGPAPVRAMGLTFPNPVGLAAGFDKNGVALAALARIGFGFVELGTVTRRGQPGNPKPRMFRLPAERAVINRLGFNNAGFDALAARLRDRPRAVPVGVNIGPNKDALDPVGDLACMASGLAAVADYITLNVSSPNTPGLSDWQAPERLEGLVRAVCGGPPVVVKIAPDVDDAMVADIVAAAIAGGAAGMIVSNTTLARPEGLRGAHAREAGGLSGPPLAGRATALLARVAAAAVGRLTLIGCGGIGSAADVRARLNAGADLVQLYTAFAYDGPAGLHRILGGLA